MSKFGFQNGGRETTVALRSAVTRMSAATVKHFLQNFDKESWGSMRWQGVQRATPPPILNVTGRLKSNVATGLKIISYRAFRIEADPVDERGRGYAKYHNEGIGTNPQRSFAKQDDELTITQLNILKEETGRIWQRL